MPSSASPQATSEAPASSSTAACTTPRAGFTKATAALAAKVGLPLLGGLSGFLFMLQHLLARLIFSCVTVYRPAAPFLPCPAGLPEEVAHTKACLARGYAVLALASKNREDKNRCFSSSGDPNKSESRQAAAAAAAPMPRQTLNCWASNPCTGCPPACPPSNLPCWPARLPHLPARLPACRRPP